MTARVSSTPQACCVTGVNGPQLTELRVHLGGHHRLASETVPGLLRVRFTGWQPQGHAAAVASPTSPGDSP